MEVQRPRATAPPTYQLLLPLELPESLDSRARLLASTVLPQQVWGTLSLTERLRAQQVFVRIIQEVLGNDNRC